MPEPQLFGTDGIRAPFGEAPLDEKTITALAYHLGRHLLEAAESDEPPSVVLGGDTRDSTPEICRWLTAGLTAAGCQVRYLGVIPTPGVAYITRHGHHAAGVVVSASHNPHPDNGVKLLDPRGYKWSSEAEVALEERLAAEPDPDVPAAELPPPTQDAVAGYLATLASSVHDTATAGAALGNMPLEDVKIVLDPGYGAASAFAERLFRDLGATVVVLHDTPDGTNVNRGAGSTHPEKAAEAVREHGADLGATFDGDADRVVLVDETGEVRDGDAILYLWADRLLARGDLKPASIVATSMSNLGLVRALEERGISVTRCDVGDRVVVECMKQEGVRLGGEQSGHIINLGLATTGDGLLTALHMAAVVAAAKAQGHTLSEMLAGFTRYPQVLVNVPVSSKPPWEDLPAVQEAAEAVRTELGNDGRLLLRYSGTEPVARVMLEGPDQEVIEELADRVVEALRSEIGAEAAA